MKWKIKTYLVRDDRTNVIFEVRARTIARVYKRYPGDKYSVWDKSRLKFSGPRQMSVRWGESVD